MSLRLTFWIVRVPVAKDLSINFVRERRPGSRTPRTFFRPLRRSLLTTRHVLHLLVVDLQNLADLFSWRHIALVDSYRAGGDRPELSPTRGREVAMGVCLP